MGDEVLELDLDIGVDLFSLHDGIITSGGQSGFQKIKEQQAERHEVEDQRVDASGLLGEDVGLHQVLVAALDVEQSRFTYLKKAWCL